MGLLLYPEICVLSKDHSHEARRQGKDTEPFLSIRKSLLLCLFSRQKSTVVGVRGQQEGLRTLDLVVNS